MNRTNLVLFDVNSGNNQGEKNWFDDQRPWLSYFFMIAVDRKVKFNL